MVALLEKDINWAINRHKNLQYNEKKFTLSGKLELDFSNFRTKKVGVASLDVEIDFNGSSDSLLPIVKAIGVEPKLILIEVKEDSLDELHINNNKTICLCIPEKEIKHFPDGNFDIKIFFKEILEFYVYWIYYYKNTKQKLDDYSHGILGYFELFSENGIKFDVFLKKFKNLKNDYDPRIDYIEKCMAKENPINFKKHKLRIHNNCLCKKSKNKYGKHGRFNNCLSIYNAIRKINIEIKKRKCIRRNLTK